MTAMPPRLWQATTSALLTLSAITAAHGLRLTGQVTDEAGAPVAGAHITFTYQVDPGEQFDAFTDRDGQYDILVEPNPTAVEATEGPGRPSADQLLPNYPNPFNPSTALAYRLGRDSQVSLVIYSSIGQRVRTLVRGQQDRGEHVVIWHGRDDQGRRLAAGVYLFRLSTDASVLTGKMLMLDGAAGQAAGSHLAEPSPRRATAPDMRTAASADILSPYRVTIVGPDTRTYFRLDVSLPPEGTLDFRVQRGPFHEILEGDFEGSEADAEALNAIGGRPFIINGNLALATSRVAHEQLTGLTEVVGSVTVWHGSPTSLAGLDSLTTIYGDLVIRESGALSALRGLDNLSTVLGQVTVWRNPHLETLAGLGGLRHVTGDIWISSNPSLTELVDLSRLSDFGAALRITFNDSLRTLEDLRSLVRFPGTIAVTYNASLPDLRGLRNLTEVGGLVVGGVPSLDGLQGLETVTGPMTCQRLPLATLQGLASLKVVGGTLHIGDMPTLSNLTGLAALSQVGGLSVTDNPALTDLAGLERLSRIGESGFTVLTNEHLVQGGTKPLRMVS